MLIAVGYAREVRAKASTPVWRQDGETGAAFALKLTAAGAKAIAMEGAPPDGNVGSAGGAAPYSSKRTPSREIAVVLPGRITLITLAMPSRVGLA